MNDLLKPFLLHGKVALVTGASSGFGRHFAPMLAQAGAKAEGGTDPGGGQDAGSGGDQQQ